MADDKKKKKDEKKDDGLTWEDVAIATGVAGSSYMIYDAIEQEEASRRQWEEFEEEQRRQQQYSEDEYRQQQEEKARKSRQQAAAKNQTHTASARASNSGVYVVETEKLYDPQTGKYTDIDVYTDEKGRRFTVDGERIYDAEPVKETPQARTATAQNKTHTASARANAQGGYTTTGLKPDGTRETIQFNQDGSVRSVDGKPAKQAQPKAQAKPAQQKPALSQEVQKKLEQKKAKGKAHYDQKMAENKRKLDAQKKGKTPPKNPPKPKAQLKGHQEAKKQAAQNQAQAQQKQATQNKQAQHKNTPPKQAENQSWWQRAKNWGSKKIESAKNKAKSAYNTVKQNKYVRKVADSKVGKAAKSAVKTATKAVTKVATPVVNAGKKIVKKTVEAGKATYNYSANAGKRWTKTAMKYGEKIGGKVGVKAVKTFAKKIPLIGAAVGTGLAIYEITQGNYGRAAAEFASGAVACVPGWGTAASFAIDGAVIAYDVYENKQQEKAQQAAQAQAAKQQQQQQQNQKQKQNQQQKQAAPQQQQQQQQAEVPPQRQSAPQQNYGYETYTEPVAQSVGVAAPTYEPDQQSTTAQQQSSPTAGNSGQTMTPERINEIVTEALQGGRPIPLENLDPAIVKMIQEAYARFASANQNTGSPAPSTAPAPQAQQNPQAQQGQQTPQTPTATADNRPSPAELRQHALELKHKQEFDEYKQLLNKNPEAFNRIKEDLKANQSRIAGAAARLELLEDVEKHQKLEKQLKKDQAKASEKMAKIEKLKNKDGKDKKIDKLQAQVYDLNNETAAMQKEMDALQKGGKAKEQMLADRQKMAAEKEKLKESTKGNIFSGVSNWVEKKSVQVNAGDASKTEYTLSGFEGRDPSKASKLCNGVYTVQYDNKGNPAKVLYQADKNAQPIDLNLTAEQAAEFKTHLVAAGKNYAGEAKALQNSGNVNG